MYVCMYVYIYIYIYICVYIIFIDLHILYEEAARVAFASFLRSREAIVKAREMSEGAVHKQIY